MTTFNGRDQVITTMAQLEELYPQPVYPPAKVKEAIRITKAYRALIQASPFCAIATSGPGGLDCSPRGDPRGFARVIDENTMAVPDRRGNNRIDSLRNLIIVRASRCYSSFRASARHCASWVAQRSRPTRSCARVSSCRASRRAAY
jgi:predicted pyridoxine 5'-phosphate oxidase superfamily flavin-nucleotide-binding protein